MYENLIESLERAGMSYTRLAREIGMPISTMHDKFHGRTAFSLDEAIKIREALNEEMPVEKLFKGGLKKW